METFHGTSHYAVKNNAQCFARPVFAGELGGVNENQMLHTL